MQTPRRWTVVAGITISAAVVMGIAALAGISRKATTAHPAVPDGVRIVHGTISADAQVSVSDVRANALPMSEAEAATRLSPVGRRVARAFRASRTTTAGTGSFMTGEVDAQGILKVFSWTQPINKESFISMDYDNVWCDSVPGGAYGFVFKYAGRPFCYARARNAMTGRTWKPQSWPFSGWTGKYDRILSGIAWLDGSDQFVPEHTGTCVNARPADPPCKFTYYFYQTRTFPLSKLANTTIKYPPSRVRSVTPSQFDAPCRTGTPPSGWPSWLCA